MALRAAIVALALSGALATAAGAGQAKACAGGQLRLLAPVTQGTATEALASVSLQNRGAACRLAATITVAVLEHGARVTAIRDNPVSVRVSGALSHGTTLVLNAWWSNWCGNRRAFTARAALGSAVASRRFSVLPYCDTPGAPSRLQGVLEPLSPEPHVGP